MPLFHCFIIMLCNGNSVVVIHFQSHTQIFIIPVILTDRQFCYRFWKPHGHCVERDRCCVKWTVLT